MQSPIRTCVIATALLSTHTAAAEIDLTMTGFANDDGKARIVLMEGIDGYTSVQPVTLTASVPIEAGVAHWRVDVTPGTYAIIAHHDSNENNALDRPVFQLPLEPYGYSNGAWTSLGLPRFNDVAFEVGEGIARQRIPMRTNAFVTLMQIVATAAVALAVFFTFVTLGRRPAVRQSN